MGRMDSTHRGSNHDVIKDLGDPEELSPDKTLI